jgi:hypothetical protein
MFIQEPLPTATCWAQILANKEIFHREFSVYTSVYSEFIAYFPYLKEKLGL